MMSNFDKAYEKTMGHEGKYSNDPIDTGGETYKGISRRFNPSWRGWEIIDNAKNYPSFPHNLENMPLLHELEKSFYKERYFDVFNGEDMPEDLAIEMFDTGVNMGVNRATTFLQKALNVLNKNQKIYPDIVEDGAYGPNTHNTMKTAIDKGLLHFILKVMNILQGMHYIDYMTKSPKQERFAKGWFNRVQINK